MTDTPTKFTGNPFKIRITHAGHSIGLLDLGFLNPEGRILKAFGWLNSVRESGGDPVGAAKELHELWEFAWPNSKAEARELMPNPIEHVYTMTPELRTKDNN